MLPIAPLLETSTNWVSQTRQVRYYIGLALHERFIRLMSRLPNALIGAFASRRAQEIHSTPCGEEQSLYRNGAPLTLPDKSDVAI